MDRGTLAELARLVALTQVQRGARFDADAHGGLLGAGLIEFDEWGQTSDGTPNVDVRLTPRGERELRRLLLLEREYWTKRRATRVGMASDRPAVERVSGRLVGPGSSPGGTPGRGRGASPPNGTSLSRAPRAITPKTTTSPKEIHTP